jgi:hypothetical protein
MGANPSYSDIIATTIQSRSGVIADNVTKNNALLSRLKKRGNVKKFSGGNEIVEELSFAENGNAGWYSGYETLPVAAQDVISAANYDIKQCAVPVTISGLEQLQNAGRERIIDLMEGRISVAESTMNNLVAQGVYSDGTGSGGKEITGLALQVADDPSTGTVGGIDRAAFPFWRNQKFEAVADGGGATTKDNIQEYFNTIWASLVRGMDRPDMIIVDNEYWKFYMASLQNLQRFSSTQDADLGFVSIKFMDADVVLDGGIGGFMGSKEAYFLNTKYIKYRPHSARDMVPLSPNSRYSVNQDAEVQILAWAGNLTSCGLQFQGKMIE